jgi:hypothetical protein
MACKKVGNINRMEERNRENENVKEKEKQFSNFVFCYADKSLLDGLVCRDVRSCPVELESQDASDVVDRMEKPSRNVHGLARHTRYYGQPYRSMSSFVWAALRQNRVRPETSGVAAMPSAHS